MKLILENWRKYLKEEVFGAQSYLYHGSRTEPDKMLDILVGNTFKPGGAAGSIYGKGLYTIYEEVPESGTMKGTYGKYIYKLRQNLNGFIIFNRDVCKKVYGKPMTVREQLTLLKKHKAIRLLEDKKLDLDFRLEENSEIPVRSYALILKRFVQGIVFPGKDKTVVIYDTYGTVPLGHKIAGSSKDYIRFGKGQIRQAINRSATGWYESGRFDNLEQIKRGKTEFEGDLDLSYSPVYSLPPNLKVNGTLTLTNTPIKSLPQGISVGGSLFLQHSSIQTLLTDTSPIQQKGLPRFLPLGLEIGKHLNISNTSIDFLPRALKVGGNLFLANTAITELPDDLYVGGSIIGNNNLQQQYKLRTEPEEEDNEINI